MTAAGIARALGGCKSGTQWIACCPAHDDRKPSLSICDADDGKVLVRCHAGCEQARVIAALRDRGLWATGGRRYCRKPTQSHSNHRDGENVKPSAEALAIWDASVAATGTLAETYLRSRGLRLPPPNTLRFHAGLWHPSGVRPAMVALVTRGTDDEPLAVHRTFLRRDGSGKALVDSPKLMLGPCRGGSVRLGRVQPDQWLIIAEGIETTLSVMEAGALPGWAALSASGIRNLILPPQAAMVLICADNDANGTGRRAAEGSAERFLREGRRVRLAMPPTPGTDFNDVFNPADPFDLDGEARDVA
jgi:putative DNA primase/helicase